MSKRLTELQNNTDTSIICNLPNGRWVRAEHVIEEQRNNETGEYENPDHVYRISAGNAMMPRDYTEVYGADEWDQFVASIRETADLRHWRLEGFEVAYDE